MINRYSYFVQFLILMAVIVLAVLVAQVLTIGVLLAGGVTIGDMLSGSNMENIGLMKAAQIISQLFIFIVPAVVFSYLKTNRWFRYPQFKMPVSGRALFFTVIILVFSFPLIGQINLWNQAIELPSFLSGLEELFKTLEEQAKELTEAFLKMDNIFDLLINLLMVGVLAGLGEELLFRGVIQKFLTEWSKNPHFAIIFTGFVFSLIHMQFYGFFPRWLLGVLFGYIFYWTGNIWIPVIAHSLFNGSQVLVYYFVGNESSFMSDFESVDSITSDQKMALGLTALVSTLLLTFVLRSFYKHSKNKQSIMVYGKELDENI